MSGYNWDAIKAQHPIADVIADAVQLKQKGNEYVGLCPFHDEKTPSFYVVPDKEFYHCHGCGAHGDVVDFIKNYQGCTVGEAVNMLTGGHDIEQNEENKKERAALLEKRNAEQEAKRAHATSQARAAWAGAGPADPHHPYLIRKGVEAHSLRQTSDGKLMLPIYDNDGAIQSIQTIDDNGNKKFLPNAPVAHGRMNIGVNMGRSIICEGYATGASIFEAIPDQVCVAYSCDNMEKVARQKHSEGHSFILAPDTGTSAQKMQALGNELGVAVIPPKTALPDGGTDFNDQAKAFGIDDVAKDFRDTIKEFSKIQDRRHNIPEQETGPVDLWAGYNAPELPRGLLPPLIEQYAFESANQMGTDPAGFAMSALSCCASVICDSIKVKPKEHENWQESARIWTMLIGPPSTRKTPMMAKTAGAIKRMDAEQLGINNRLLADWQDAGGPKSGDPKPHSPRLRIEDATTEAVQEVAKESPSGILLLQDELSGFFGRIDKYGGKGGGADRSFWLQSYGGGQYAVNRVGRGSFLIDNLSVTMLGGIQPGPLASLMRETVDDGLIQRFIPVALRRAELDKDVPIPPVAEKFDELLVTLRAMRPNSNFFGDKPFLFSKGGKAVREELAERHFRIVSAFEGVNTKLSTHIGKFDGLFVRLSLLWHCIENAGKEAPEHITEKTARNVADFLSGFIMGHSFAFYGGKVGLSDNHDIVKAVGGYILAHKIEKITAGFAYRSIRQFRKANEIEREQAMNALEAFGWLKPSTGNGLNRVSKPEWDVVPDVHNRFSSIAIEERERRAQVQDIIKNEIQEHGKNEG